MSAQSMITHPKARQNVRIRTGQVSNQIPAGVSDVSIQRRAHSHNIEPSTNVFINYIPPEYTEHDLRDLCAPYGKITASKIMINLETGQSKCFGFVRFQTLEEAQTAIRGLNGKPIGTKRLLAKYAESNEKKEKASMTVYVKRLPMNCDENYVVSLFQQFGDILQISPHVIDTIDPQYWRCFIRYSNFESANNAIATMNNKIVIPGTRPIHVRYADEAKLNNSLTNRNSYQAPSQLDYTDERQLLPSFFFM